VAVGPREPTPARPPADCSSAAAAICSAPFVASIAARSASTAVVSTSRLSAEMRAMSSRRASSASTADLAALASSDAFAAAFLRLSTTPRTSFWIASASSCTSRALLSDVSASVRTSSATTAKPRP